MSPNKTLLLAGLAAVALAGCASHKPPPPAPYAPPPPPPPAAGGNAVPGGYVGSDDSSTPSASDALIRDFINRAGSDRVYFDYDHSDLRQEARTVLNAQAAWLNGHPRVNARVEGNADERGTREYNFALGERRAAAVRDYLAQQGVPAQRLTTISYGKERPVDTSGSEDGMAKNRNGHTALTQ